MPFGLKNKPNIDAQTLDGTDSVGFQAAGNELSALQSLADTAGFLKKAGDGMYTIDTSTYLTTSGKAADSSLWDGEARPSFVGNGGKYLRVNSGATDFELVTLSGGGDVVGPASAVDSRLAAFDGVTGKLLKDSGYAASAFQAAGNELTALQALADTAGFLKKTGDGAYSIDTTTYLAASAQAADSDKLDGYHLHTGSAGPAWSTIPFIKSTGYIEVGIGLDFHASASDAGDYTTEVKTSSNSSLEIVTGYGYIQLGPQNASFCHIYSDITGGFYFNQKLNLVDKDFVLGTTTGTKFGTATTQKLSFYNATPIVRPSAYTQTYSSADKTHGNFFSADITDQTAGTASTTIPVTSSSYSQTHYKNALASLINQHNNCRADIDDLKRLVNAIIDDLQALGLVG